MSNLPDNLCRFSESVRQLWNLMNPCTICPRNCKVFRGDGQAGYCGISEVPKVSSAGPHFGEEPVLVGAGGSGTIFFAGCNLGCIFCQNFDISHLCHGKDCTIEQLAETMLRLQNVGCSNINLVTPTHMAAAIAAAIEYARTKGLTLPIVYNTGGYDSPDTLKLLAGLIDIYMPDVKYADSKVAQRLSDAPDYPAVNRAAVKEMHSQVGDLHVEKGLTGRGLLVRHLVLPNQLAGSFEIIDFLANVISPSTAVNIMDQYHPCYKAEACPKINRRPSREEITKVRDYALQKGLTIIT